MQASSYLERALFHDQTLATREYFESKAGQLFAQPNERYHVELHVQRLLRIFPESAVNSEHAFTFVQKCETEPSSRSESPADSWYPEDGSPRTKIERWRISDAEEFKCYAAVRSYSC